jgi:hypothetical protein
MSELCKILQGFIRYLYVRRHKPVLRFSVFTSKPTSLLASNRDSVFLLVLYMYMPNELTVPYARMWLCPRMKNIKLRVSLPIIPAGMQLPMKHMTSRNKRTSVQDLLFRGPLNVGSYFTASPETKEMFCYHIFDL